MKKYTTALVGLAFLLAQFLSFTPSFAANENIEDGSGDTGGGNDTVTLSIYDVEAEITINNAIIRWKTTEPTTSWLAYRKVGDTDWIQSQAGLDTTFVLEHVNGTFLTVEAGQQYEYYVYGSTAAGDSIQSTVGTFNTTATVPDYFIPYINVVSGGTETLFSSDPVDEGTVFEFRAAVDNHGTAYAPTTTVNLLIDDVIVSSSTVALLEPGGRGLSESLMVWNTTPGTHTITFKVDPFDLVDEFNESNNIWETVILVNSDEIIPPTLADWTTYESTKYFYTINYPSDWTLIGGNSNSNNIGWYPNGKRQSIHVEPYNKSLEYWAEKLKSHKNNANITNLTIAGVPAKRVTDPETGYSHIGFIRLFGNDSADDSVAEKITPEEWAADQPSGNLYLDTTWYCSSLSMHVFTEIAGAAFDSGQYHGDCTNSNAAVTGNFDPQMVGAVSSSNVPVFTLDSHYYLGGDWSQKTDSGACTVELFRHAGTRGVYAARYTCDDGKKLGYQDDIQFIAFITPSDTRIEDVVLNFKKHNAVADQSNRGWLYTIATDGTMLDNGMIDSFTFTDTNGKRIVGNPNKDPKPVPLPVRKKVKVELEDDKSLLETKLSFRKQQQIEKQSDVLEREKLETLKRDEKLVERLKGKVLLQVEESGEAYYVDPVSKTRYYLPDDGDISYTALEQFGLGITSADIELIPIGVNENVSLADSDSDGLSDKMEEILGTDVNNPDSDGDGFKDGEEVKNNYSPRGLEKLRFDADLTNRLEGRIVLQVDNKGAAWYIHNGRRYYMQNGDQVYKIMKYLSLGITNSDLRQIPVSGLQ